MLKSIFNNTFMSKGCGSAVYNLGVETGTTFGLVHSTHLSAFSKVYKQSEKTPSYTQPYQLLYTVCGQIFFVFSSVSRLLVHIIHIAYKENDYLKKRII